MRKLIAWEFGVTVLCALVYFVGLFFGLKPHVACFTVTAFVVLATIAAAAIIGFADAGTIGVAASTIFVVVITSVAAFTDKPYSINTAAVTVVFLALMTSYELKLKRSWVVLSLVAQQAILYVIFRHGHLILPT